MFLIANTFAICFNKDYLLTYLLTLLKLCIREIRATTHHLPSTVHVTQTSSLHRMRMIMLINLFLSLNYLKDRTQKNTKQFNVAYANIKKHSQKKPTMTDKAWLSHLLRLKTLNGKTHLGIWFQPQSRYVVQAMEHIWDWKFYHASKTLSQFQIQLLALTKMCLIIFFVIDYYYYKIHLNWKLN